VEAFRVRRPDVLVSDVGISGEDGYALVRKVQPFGSENGVTRRPWR
jgi:hypothetical protein